LKMLSERNKLRSESPFGKNKHFKFWVFIPWFTRLLHYKILQ
jgi:hypothetical protein